MNAVDDPPCPTYSFKPSLFGAVWEFRLAPDSIEWKTGARAGRINYRDVRRVRLSFRPVTMQTYRFLTEIWGTSGPKIEIASSSWRSMVEQERHDAAYSTFVGELHRRLAKAQPAAAFQTGTPALLYWPGLVVFAVVVLALVALALRALQVEAWAGATMICGFLVLMLWQAGTFFRRNRPRVYRPDSPPVDLLPCLSS